METRDTEAKATPAANCLCLCFPMGLYTAGTSKLPLLGQIEPATCFYTVLLEHSHAHQRPANESVCVLFMAAFSAPQTGEDRERGERDTAWPGSLEYLLPGPLQKRFSDPCF